MINRNSTFDSVIITGGAGFIGTNLASKLLDENIIVKIFDNFSRTGSEKNAEWLRKTYGDKVTILCGDVRDSASVKKAIENASHIFHFAAQVAVTRSIENPIDDFETNVRGTLNILEEARKLSQPPVVLFTSTNKVFGEIAELNLIKKGTRYEIPGYDNNFIKDFQLSFYSPYGCSKGAADQYVLDYARIFGIPTIVFRMSCIYGEHQFGNEDQGWVAHIMKSALQNNPITIYGDGLQVRDILYVDDLIKAMILACQNIQKVSGNAFSIGGGKDNTISLIELIDYICKIRGKIPPIKYAAWRPGDQKYYVSNIENFTRATNWKPVINVQNGLNKLYKWIVSMEPAIDKKDERYSEPWMMKK